ETGHFIFLGATTENPSFEVISPLLSRTKVYVLEPLTTPQIVELLRRALADKDRGLGNEAAEASDDILFRIASFANGDARAGYNTLELAVRGAQPSEKGACVITPELLEDVLQRKLLRYDKAGEEHYNLISALHKSIRNSDPDAALYWLARMLESGEDPLYLARRMVRMASEDIGLAEPGALAVTLAAKDAFDFLGAPEGHLALAQAAVYLSLAPKSNAVYTAYGEVIEDVHKTEAEPVPLHIRNAVTGLMKNISYGKGYGDYLGLPRFNQCWATSTGTCYFITPYHDVEILTSDTPQTNHMLETIGVWTEDAGALRNYFLARGLKPGDLASPYKGEQQFEIADPEEHHLIFLSSRRPRSLLDSRMQISHHMIHAGFVVSNRAAEDRFYKGILGFHV